MHRIIKKIKKQLGCERRRNNCEIRKKLPAEEEKEIISTIKEIRNKAIIPENLRMSRIFPIHKKGDINDIGNYREVSLLDAGNTIITMIIESRLEKWLDREGKLSEAHASFRKREEQ